MIGACATEWNKLYMKWCAGVCHIVKLFTICIFVEVYITLIIIMMNKCTIYTVLHSYPYVQVTVFNTVLEHNLCIYQLYEYFSQKQFIKWIVLKNVKLLNITPVSLKLLKLIFPGPISRGNLGVTVYRKWFQKTSPRELSLIPVCGIKATLTQRLTVFPVWFSGCDCWKP